MEYFCAYHSYFKKCEKLTDQELGRLFRALLMYSSTGERHELAGRESIAFDFIADDIDRQKESYKAKCEQNKANRSSTTVNDRQRPSTTVHKNKDKGENKNKEIEAAENSARAIKLCNEGIARVMSLYFDRIDPTPSRTSIELLQSYVETLGPDVCERAINCAIDAGARKWMYIHAILRNCEKDGIRSLADWDNREDERQRRNEGRKNNAGTEEPAESKYHLEYRTV